ncbi:helix-turn-helix transcriptional regulator [Actinomadura sp. HBU206391]|uniref:helix-turn-helix transcriptional regulator n=1 Tax=Actinomadura sp. HBU206391 TaxID=2731692 RepID=UPI00164FFA4B|nr:YafY family protein [Actinomadura sp. HBU206391]MBC6459526.1 YafY family transcriptional regulator [Actinomadura sp. HBU206391]
MRDPSGRLLQLLSLLQTPREWSGTELAGRLGVTPRTIRRDVDRLRELGYPVRATQGNTGGYRLTAGAAMPPLVLEDEEAIAVAIGLRTAASAAITGIEDTSLRALAKLEQVLPVRLRHRVTTLSEAAVTLPPRDGPAADADVLASVAAACVAHEKVRFAYTKGDGEMTRRLVEPHRLVASGRRWYLVAFDENRADWRTFRVDRITEVHRTGVRVPGRDLPGGTDAATWVMESLSGYGDARSRLLLHVPIEAATELVPASHGVLEPVDDRSCRLHTHADSLRYLAYRIALLPMDYTLLGPPELAEHLGAIAERAGRAISAFTGTSRP